ncbi:MULTISPECIES: replication protein [Photorhabdus]|uniref:Phage replication protein O n=2 Tax=Photorhabdus asymbiotica TaxID=291112 RepID=C7BH51_PHOAA|nr:replication protein [Photorhabdus asymbiotica]RKS59519.1 phage replication protein O [Photorhabdus asymbiotica]CAQ85217.1 phage replication protein o [Photorhabdus asymbiotica]CAQ85662.1 Phage replication protein O [Photorhabdus asymbiotica]
MNTAEVINFPALQRREVVKVADVDDGYTRIANELLESIMSADLTARQLKVVLAIIRKTYGFGKKTDRITNTQIAEMTGIHHTHVCKAKNEMIAMKIIVLSGNQIGINKIVSEWSTDISRLSETLAKSANKTLAKSANEDKPSQLNTKETIQKKKEINDPLVSPLPEKPKPKPKTKFDPAQVEIPDWLSGDAWAEWVSYRQQSGKPIKTQITVTKAFNLLKECFDEGHDPADVINTSIANGYQGLFKPKYPLRAKQGLDFNNTDWIDGLTI